jgi:hypothetical protein
MDADRERAYNGVGRRAAQNLAAQNLAAQNHDAAYRSRWTVNAAGGRPAFPVKLSSLERRSAVPPAGRLPIDLGPLVRLAQEACWGRFFNRPRHSAIGDA